MRDGAEVRPELIRLGAASRARIRDIAANHHRCHNCGGTEFEVGDALYLGFLFLDEDDDAYMVALTCLGPECSQPHTGVTVHGGRAEYPEFA